MKFKKALKRIGMGIIGIVVLIILIIVVFVNFSPELGGTISKSQKAKYASSNNYKDGVFENMGGVEMSMGFSDMVKTSIKFFQSQPNTKPDSPIPVQKVDSAEIADYKGKTRLIWFGHSAFLLQMNTKTILIDPMFGDVPAPHPWLGNKRFSTELPIEVEKIPLIDAVIFSHDHYDHLDYGSVLKLKDKVKMFYVPLGVGVHLEKWGVSSDKIVEMDWWEETTLEDLSIKCTPAQHFSGRGMTNRGSTLWASWIIQSSSQNIFFSGDSGYGSHFKEIGDKFGPFDFAMIECGQYNEMWKEIHMMPEETAQAAVDLNAKEMMPIHWGAFKLALHPWTEPVNRLSVKAAELNVKVATPRIGEEYTIGENLRTNFWWK